MIPLGKINFFSFSYFIYNSLLKDSAVLNKKFEFFSN
ncbi:hypothetical protein VPHD479_0378 [Vibrio phage D479]